MFDKNEILHLIRAQIVEELKVAEKAVRNAEEATTHDDAKSEGKYDTRAIESGYLAGAQRNRHKELEQKLAYLEALKIPFAPHEKVQSLSVVLVGAKWLFIIPFVGGRTISIDGTDIAILSPDTPLAQKLMGLEAGDEIDAGEINEIF